MSVVTNSKKSRYAVLLLVAALAACSKNEQTGTEATAAAPAAAPIAAPPAPVVSAQIQAMGIEELRAAASKALNENRIYAPGGDNAMEYYLALRDKLPTDPAVTSALTDLMPYTVIATEQSIGREDFVEAQRLSALMEKADPKAPALPRLKQTIATAQQALAARAVTEETEAETAAEAEAKEKLRLAQQAEQQKGAAEALAAQQQQDAARAAETERAAAAQREAEQQRAAAAAAAAPPPTTPARPAASTASTASASLKVVSAPSPRYPPEALRSGTRGEVLVEITVGPDGSVTNARVVRATPPRVFDREALNAVRRWKFEPIDASTTTRRTIAFNPG